MVSGERLSAEEIQDSGNLFEVVYLWLGPASPLLFWFPEQLANARLQQLTSDESLGWEQRLPLFPPQSQL